MNDFDNLHPLLEQMLRSKVKEMLREVFDLPLDLLMLMGRLREIGQDTGRFIDIEKITECMNAQFVILEMLLDIMVPTDDADIKMAAENKEEMINRLAEAKKAIL